MKTCYKCKETKPLDSFHRDSSKPDGHWNQCKDCYKSYSKGKTRQRKPKHEISALNTELLIGFCSVCQETVPVYKRHSNHKIYYYCTKSRFKYDDNYYNNHTSTGKSHGLSDKARRIFINGKVCAICGSDKDLMVDHCHQSNKLRDVLCRNCNYGLGFFKDSMFSLEKAIVYLKKHQAPLPGQEDT